MAFIRMYQESDKDAMIHIFRETAAPDLRSAGDPGLHYASFLWCRPYLMLAPDSCFVLDDGNGHAVGYLLGVPDTVSFVQKYKDTYTPYLQSQGFEQPGPDEQTGWNENLPNALRQIMFSPHSMLHTEYPRLMEQWPAHIHIDILTPYQKQGWGRRLIEQFCGVAKERGARGVHLLMAAANDDAGRFYPRRFRHHLVREVVVSKPERSRNTSAFKFQEMEPFTNVSNHTLVSHSYAGSPQDGGIYYVMIPMWNGRRSIDYARRGWSWIFDQIRDFVATRFMDEHPEKTFLSPLSTW